MKEMDFSENYCGGLMMNNLKQIEEIRKFNRFYANVLGKIDQEIYQQPYPLAEARVLSELHAQKGATASEIREKLGLDRGYISRMLQKFEDSELIFKQQSADDKRRILLGLTEKGEEIHQQLVKNANLGVSKMVAALSERDLLKLTAAMETIESLLQAQQVPDKIIIRPYGPGDAGYIAHLHGTLYGNTHQFSHDFEFYVVKGLAEFMADPSGGQLWIAEVNGVVAGSIAIAKAGDHTAQLRWFIMDEEFQGLGIGKILMETAIDFCREQGYQHVFLWTVNILEAARYLYSKYGFKLIEQKMNTDWTADELTEERWDLELEPIKALSAERDVQD